MYVTAIVFNFENLENFDSFLKFNLRLFFELGF